MIAARTIYKLRLPWPAPLMAEKASRITHGTPKASPQKAIFWATTSRSPRSATRFLAPGRTRHQKKEKLIAGKRPGPWCEWAPQNSEQSGVPHCKLNARETKAICHLQKEQPGGWAAPSIDAS